MLVDSDDPVSYGSRGTAYLQLGHYERAIQDFDRALAIYSDGSNTRFDEE